MLALYVSKNDVIKEFFNKNIDAIFLHGQSGVGFSEHSDGIHDFDNLFVCDIINGFDNDGFFLFMLAFQFDQIIVEGFEIVFGFSNFAKAFDGGRGDSLVKGQLRIGNFQSQGQGFFGILRGLGGRDKGDVASDFINLDEAGGQEEKENEYEDRIEDGNQVESLESLGLSSVAGGAKHGLRRLFFFGS